MEGRDALPRISGSGEGRVIEYGEGNVHVLMPAMVDLERQQREMAERRRPAAVLTVNLPGVDWSDAADGAAIARDVNDELAQLSRDQADRLLGISPCCRCRRRPRPPPSWSARSARDSAAQ